MRSKEFSLAKAFEASKGITNACCERANQRTMKDLIKSTDGRGRFKSVKSAIKYLDDVQDSIDWLKSYADELEREFDTCRLWVERAEWAEDLELEGKEA